MKIVVLDGYTLNPGDLSWDNLKKLGDCEIFDRTPPKKTLERSEDAEIILTNKTALPKEILLQLPQLKYIGVLATGYNVVDLETAKQNNIIVTNIPAYSTDSVAQMVFAHILNFTQHVNEHSTQVKSGKWAKSIDFCYWDFPMIELSGLHFGIIGTGRIGLATAKLALAFGMKVLAYNKNKPKNLPEEIKFISLDELMSQSDIVSLHCPLKDETHEIINKKTLDLMKPSAFLINTGRGPLINENALADALNEGKIAGAGLDVLSMEPPKENNPLYKAKNCYITPHIAWATKSARSRLMDIAVENVKAYIDRKPQNIVNL